MKSVIASDYRLTLSRRSDFHALARTKWPSVRVDRACLHIHSFTSTYTNSSTTENADKQRRRKSSERKIAGGFFLSEEPC